MSDDTNEILNEAFAREAEILQSVKKIVTNVIKETATAPGMKHPLSEETLADMRECLLLISNREQQLAEALGKPMNMRPRFKDDPRARQEVVVPLRPHGKDRK